jgi:two-component system response regulator CpxR
MTTLLLIDDDMELCSLLTDLLSLEGFDIEQAHDGLSGLNALHDGIDLILLDVMMPKMNGMDVLKELRKTRITPVLMLTAKGEEMDRVLGLELGADDYLPKPFGDRELLARIRALLRRAELIQKQQPSIKAIDDLQLNLGQQEVLCQGQPIQLTATEFQLLSYLVEHSGQIIDKNTLSYHVLGKHLAPFDRSLDVHISNLRKKLPPRKDQKPRIKTLRSKGILWLSE